MSLRTGYTNTEIHDSWKISLLSLNTEYRSLNQTNGYRVSLSSKHLTKAPLRMIPEHVTVKNKLAEKSETNDSGVHYCLLE